MINILDIKKISIKKILEKRKAEEPDVSASVSGILKNVWERGDEAVLEYTKRFDGVEIKDTRVCLKEIDEAFKNIDSELLEIMREAANNIQEYHKLQLRTGFVKADKDGVVMGQRIIPLEKVGVYVPGGTAAYPSTVFMDCIPAKIAGVGKIIITTPPDKNGKIPVEILAAAKIAGIDEIYKVGGAQAVAALSKGTSTIPRVDKIVGPGNVYVATAKKMVYGIVDIDMIAGPSDVLVIADETANPIYVAADMLAQAEHDENASAVLITISEKIAHEVKKELATQIEKLSRKQIAEASIKKNGIIILCEELEQAVAVSNEFAPEHLELCVEEPFSLLSLVKNAGSVFLGHHTPEALGDYFAGPNHTLPTGGTARFYSPLGVDDFVKKSSYLYYSQKALHDVGEKVAKFAQSEGLDAHAQSVHVRLKDK